MKTLVIDSHKGSDKLPSNLHTLNAKVLSDKIGADLIWSYPSVNDNIKTNYDVIVFSHASHYSFVDYEWVKQSPNARLFFISNEYNLGEPRALWMAIKRDNRKYEVIANHDSKISKIVTKYTTAWHKINLNALVHSPQIVEEEKEGSLYYGSYRKGREKYFQKYFDGMTVSTHSKNREKFLALGINPQFINRIDWKKNGLASYKTSLYIEDEITHANYNFLANRFYESLNYGVLPLFDESCANTVYLSDYHIPMEYFVNSPEEFAEKTENPPEGYRTQLARWRLDAKLEKKEVLEDLARIILNGN